MTEINTERLEKGFAQLNPPQLMAVRHEIGSTPIMILGPAGSGKTLLIALRFGFILNSGEPAESILVVSHQNSKKTYLDYLIREISGAAAPCHHTARGLALAIIGKDEGGRVFGHGNADNGASSPASVAMSILQRAPHRQLRLQEQYRHILIDDMDELDQDEYDLLAVFMKRIRGISAFGDDFGLARASTPAIDGLIRDHPPLVTIQLESIRRHTGHLSGFSQEVRKLLAPPPRQSPESAGFSGEETIQIVNIPDQESEGRFVASEIKDQSAAPERIAVIARTHQYLLDTMAALEEAGVLYRKEGRIRLFRDSGLECLMSLLVLRGTILAQKARTGPIHRSIEVILKHELRESLSHPAFACTEVEAMSIIDIDDIVGMIRSPDSGSSLPVNLIRGIHRIREFIFLYEGATPLEAFRLALERFPPTESLLSRMKPAVRFVEAAATRASSAGQSGRGAHQHFASRMQSIMRGDTTDDGHFDSGVGLMTMHGARGREFDHVYLLGAVEELMPLSYRDGTDRAEISRHEREEKRLFYQAVTRSTSTLTIVTPRRITGPYGDRVVRPSPFIPASLLPGVRRLNF